MAFDRIIASEDSIGCDRECCVTPITKGVTKLNLDPKTGKAFCFTSGGACTGFTIKELTEIGRLAVLAHRDGQTLPADVTALATKSVAPSVDPMILLQQLAANLPDGATLADLVAAIGGKPGSVKTATTAPAVAVPTHTPGPVVSSGRRSAK